ncbi:hypothetical protein GCM10010965_14940 [Caldalkalibacillus thermarum]|uniref:prepilin peptidase n=1 Tax=Caldalkalibacillus thermarum TaxID=296745 RepID=UPI0016660383|nr:A24 family peptidase [Caldalkalibacillus thermarum]GGK23077.1 hypothetical protein GCM10010965_14940 [Caldalkalibacillus thermarum]
MDILAFIIFWAALFWAALYDSFYRIIPDFVPVILAVTGLILLKDPLQSLWGALIGGGLLLVMALINQNWVGGGDIKLLAGIGTAFGLSVIWILWIACFAGLLVTLVMRKKSMPFAPFLFVAAFIMNMV